MYRNIEEKLHMIRKLTMMMIITVAVVSVLSTLVVAAEGEGTVAAVNDTGMATIKATDGKEYKAQRAGVKVGDKVDCHVEGGKTSCHKLGKTHQESSGRG
jgi:hypothetical protein